MCRAYSWFSVHLTIDGGHRFYIFIQIVRLLNSVCMLASQIRALRGWRFYLAVDKIRRYESQLCRITAFHAPLGAFQDHIFHLLIWCIGLKGTFSCISMLLRQALNIIILFYLCVKAVGGTWIPAPAQTLLAPSPQTAWVPLNGQSSPSESR